jgi:hypothetical protein
MRRLVFVAVLTAAALVPAKVSAQSVFDGTWKIDTSSMNSSKPDIFLLQDGMYECKSCNPYYKIKADGSDQAVSGDPYVDTRAIKVVNDHQIDETDKKSGKVVATSTAIVSPDGKTVSFTFTDSSNSNGGSPVTGKGQAIQVAPGPPGSHAVSGSWKMSKMENMSDNGIVWTYKVNGDSLTMTSPTGQTYTAKLDGTDAQMKGDPGVTSVSVKFIGSDTLEETDKREGKVTGIVTMTVSGDGKTAKIKYDDKLQDRLNEMAAVKQ